MAAAEKDPDSILNFYRKLLKFRKENEVVVYGDYEEYYHENDKLFCYDRQYGDKKLLVICSFSDKVSAFRAPAGYDLTSGECAICNYASPTQNKYGCILKPYETRVYIFNA